MCAIVDDGKHNRLTADFTILNVLRFMLAGIHQRGKGLTAVGALHQMFLKVHGQDILPDLAQNKRQPKRSQRCLGSTVLGYAVALWRFNAKENRNGLHRDGVRSLPRGRAAGER